MNPQAPVESETDRFFSIRNGVGEQCYFGPNVKTSSADRDLHFSRIHAIIRRARHLNKRPINLKAIFHNGCDVVVIVVVLDAVGAHIIFNIKVSFVRHPNNPAF